MTKSSLSTIEDAIRSGKKVTIHDAREYGDGWGIEIEDSPFAIYGYETREAARDEIRAAKMLVAESSAGEQTHRITGIAKPVGSWRYGYCVYVNATGDRNATRRVRIDASCHSTLRCRLAECGATDEMLREAGL